MYICFLRKSGLLVLPGKGKTKQSSNQNADPVSDESQTQLLCIHHRNVYGDKTVFLFVDITCDPGLKRRLLETTLLLHELWSCVV